MGQTIVQVDAFTARLFAEIRGGLRSARSL